MAQNGFRRKTYQNYFFDLDGTLLATGPSILSALRITLDAHHVDYSQKNLQVLVGPPLKAGIIKMFAFSEEQAAQIVDEFRKNYVLDDRFLQCEVYPGIFETLSSLRDSGKRLFVATSKPQHLMVPMLDHFHLSPFFEDIQGSCDQLGLKTKGQVIVFLLNKHGLINKDTIMIGDTSNDIQGAKEAKVDSCGVLYGYGTKQELADSTFLISDIRNVLS
jgi:phosphoglycolate phosphatase